MKDDDLPWEEQVSHMYPHKHLDLEILEDSDGVAAREFKTLRNQIKINSASYHKYLDMHEELIKEQKDEIAKLKRKNNQLVQKIRQMIRNKRHLV